MIDVFEICNELVTKVKAFRETVDARKLVCERAYHFVDGNAVPKNELSVVVYPMARRKAREGSASKVVTATIYIVIKAKVLPTETARIDTLLKYGAELDEHLEGQPICGARNVITEDEQFFWFPDELHQRHHFSSLLELQYHWKDRIGGNPA